ncbi:MAG: aminotransferase class I/II-fold pyridoxal phosphate-dependent enzyme [Thiohalocapsa sp.]
MRYSPLVERIAGRGAPAWNVHMAARRRRDAGEDIISLTVGDPDQSPPEPVIEATVAALRADRTGYAPTAGYPAVRAAIAARVASRSLRPCAAGNVVVVPGTQGGLYCALQCLAGPGDEVILPEPVYATYHGVVGASGARMVTVPLRAEARVSPRPRRARRGGDGAQPRPVDQQPAQPDRRRLHRRRDRRHRGVVPPP